MKSRDEIVIIMLQWLRLYTLGTRGSRELKTFLETRLISSRVDQKLKNKEGVHGFLKREIGPNSWVVEAIVERNPCVVVGLNSRGLKQICSDSSSWTFGIQGENSMKSRDEIVIIMLQWLRLYTLGSRGSRELKTFLETRLISSRVDQKLKNKEGVHGFLKREIGPNSWVVEAIVERNPCVVVAVLRPEGVASGLAWNQSQFRFGVESRKLLDRGSIAPRSRFDRTAIVEFFHDAFLPSDGLLLDERSRFINPVRRDQDSSPPPAVRS